MLSSTSSQQSGGVKYTPSARPTFAGELKLLGASNDMAFASSRQLHVGHDLTIGRDHGKCQWVIDDPQLSATHLRVYTIVYDDEDEGPIKQLVFAEDLSRNGTFWNESLIGKGNGGFLLSHNDNLRLSAKTFLRFTVSGKQHYEDFFDLQQEREMAHFRQDFIVTDRLLGSGAFGQVFMAIEQRTRTQVACKVVDLRKLDYTRSKHFTETKFPVTSDCVNQAAQNQKIKVWGQQQKNISQLEHRLKCCYREVDILSQISHPNIISIEKVYITDSTIYMFEDLITAGDLFSYLESKNGILLEIEAAVVIRQILKALQYLHDRNIVHRDLKPENVMMTSLSAGCRVVLTDFGAARHLGVRGRTFSLVGTDEYVAPEVKPPKNNANSHLGYTKAVDMWSVGAISVVLLTGGSAFRDPFTGGFSPVLARTGNLKSLQDSREWLQIRQRPKDFIVKLLNVAEQQRMTVQQALDHDWFSNDIHKTAFEELYQRTIKNWYPRITKAPVVEFVRSTFVKHLAIPQPVAIALKRPRQGERPIEPPYKPFPRNMYIQLWPRHKPSGHIMSTEVRVALAESWTSKPSKSASHFRSLIPVAKAYSSSILAKATDLPVQKCKVVGASAMLGVETGSRMLPLRSVLTISNRDNETVVDSRHIPTTRKPETLFGGVTAVQPRSVQSNGIQKHIGRLAKSLREAAPSRLLSRRPSTSDTARSISTHWRDAMFEIWDDSDEEIGDNDDNDHRKNAKRQRTLSFNPGNDSELHRSVTLAHNYRVALMGGVDQEQPSLYLPRI